MLNEADTRAKLIDPKLKESGWTEHLINREYPISDGKIIKIGNVEKRGKALSADYLLRYTNYPVAVIEAKSEDHPPDAGMSQAKDYAKRLDIKFAYSTNGHGIVEYSFVTGLQQGVNRFPTPDELWNRLEMTKNYATVRPFLVPYHYDPVEQIRPRYYQEAAINRCVEAILKGQKYLLLTMATGTGKTYVAFQLVWKLIKSRTIKRVLFIADRNVLRDQAYNAFDAFGEGRCVISEGKAPEHCIVYFSIYQALYSGEKGKELFREYEPDFFDMIIIDECHRSGFGTWNEILRYFEKAVQLGMTATPKRKDNIDTYKYFGNPVYQYSMKQGIEDGYLAIYQIFQRFTNVDLEGIRPSEYGYFNPELEDRSYLTKDFERIIVLPDRTDEIIDDLTETLHRISPNYPKDKTIIYCVDINHARYVYQQINNKMAHLKIPNYAALIVSEEGRVARELLEDFQSKEKETPVIAVSVDMLSTGFDAPTVKNLVHIAPIGSELVYKQIKGRGSRIMEAKGKLLFNIIDYVGCTKMFEDPEFDGTPAFIEEGGDVAGKGPEAIDKVSESGEKYKVSPVPRKKVTIRGVDVFIAEKKYFEISEDGTILTFEEYIDKAKSEVKNFVPSKEELFKLYLSEEKRVELIEKLKDYFISEELLATALEVFDTEFVDMISHVAFEGALISRKQRVEAFKNNSQEFLSRYNEEQREIIFELLDKFQIGGISEINVDALEVPPISGHGSITDIVNIFGGITQLNETLNYIQQGIMSTG